MSDESELHEEGARSESWLSKNIGLSVVTALGLLTRLYWNLVVHRPVDFAYSDMGGYIGRANDVLSKPWKPYAAYTLFPYGTHFFIAAIKYLFGVESGNALGVAFALVGALSVSYGYLLALQLSGRKSIALITGAILAIYYPWISFSGYAMSEPLFALTLTATAYHALRLADRGEAKDAWRLGIFAALGMIVRPQILLSLVFIGAHFLIRRRCWRNFTRGLVVRAAVPLALVLLFSSARLYWHTGGTLGLVSTNGPLNFAFGRCHAAGIESRAKNRGSFFGPPAFIAMVEYEKKHPKPILSLDPAMGTKVRFKGDMWEAAPLREVSRKCIEKTGYVRQIKYALTHVVLLWGYNIPWPDQGQKPVFREPMKRWSIAYNALVLAPSAIMLLLALRRRRGRELLVAVHIYALLIASMLYFGDTRYRVPYDAIFILFAVEAYAAVFRALRLKTRELLLRLSPAR